MTSQIQIFRQLHHTTNPLLLGNVWNAQSAKILQKLGFSALGTSSAAVAHSLGYEDGEEMPFADYLFVIKRILASTNLPLTVDMEAGYGKDVKIIFENIKKLHQLGVVGFNIEDTFVKDGVRQFEETQVFVQKISKLSQKIKENALDIFFNVRCDAFLLPQINPLDEALQKIKLYENCAVDGIFVPYLTETDFIKKLVDSTSLPINVMCMPDLPDFEKLQAIGVKRISMGNWINGTIYQKMEELAGSIVKNQNFSVLFN